MTAISVTPRRSPWSPQSNGEDEPQHRDHRRDLIEAAAEVERLHKRTSRNWPSNTGRLLGASTICNFGRVARASVGNEVN